jgi:hypothetical protein
VGLIFTSIFFLDYEDVRKIVVDEFKIPFSAYINSIFAKFRGRTDDFAKRLMKKVRKNLDRFSIHDLVQYSDILRYVKIANIFFCQQVIP